jgi:hypothetical protein
MINTKSKRLISDFESAVKSGKSIELYRRRLEKHIENLEASIIAHNSWQRAQSAKAHRHARALRSHIEEQDAHIAIITRGKGV